ncbi:MAG: hypothetical protein JWP14_3383 [Frankiales bacterium]|nr:hypothetical protein [Frankiales bacterium]
MGRAAAAGPRLAAYVHVTNDKGNSQVFGPGDEVPAWAQRKIVNPKAWEDGELPKVRAAKPKDGDPAPGDDTEPTEEQPPADAGAADAETEGDSDATDSGSGDAPETPPGDETPQIPPRQGAGSGKAAWHAYAKTVGLDVAEDTSRDDVIELLEDAGLLEDEQA